MDQSAIETRLAMLEQEHRDLDDAIVSLEMRSIPDHLQIQRMKKRKLNLRDHIAALHSMLVPDIIA